MKRIAILGMAAAMLAGMLATPASTQELPPHPHILLLGLEFENDEPVGFRKCVDLAAGRALPLNAHHEHLHFGTAGEALFTRAGHAVVPGAPLTPWRNCAEFIEFIFGE
jgi:hypothetical protein